MLKVGDRVYSRPSNENFTVAKVNDDGIIIKWDNEGDKKFITWFNHYTVERKLNQDNWKVIDDGIQGEIL